jgi:hypothetical protein
MQKKLYIMEELLYENKSPERQLLSAIVYRAIIDIIGKDTQFDVGILSIIVTNTKENSVTEADKKSAIKWVLSNRTKPWSFIWVCNEIDKPYIVNVLRKFIQKI